VRVKGASSRLAAVRRWAAGNRLWAAAGLAVGLALAVLGQKRLWDEGAPFAATPDAMTLALFLGGAALFVVSVLALGVALWSRDDEPVPAVASDPAPSVSAWRWLSPWRAIGLALAVVLGLLAFLLNDNNTFTPAGSFCWIAAMAVLLVVFWEWRRPLLPRPRWPWSRDGDLAAPPLARRLAAGWPLFAVAAITGLGAFFRLYDLAGVPKEMVSDHVEKILDVNDILHGQFSVYFPRLEGREGSVMYAAAGLVKFTPLHMDFLALKLASALAGILAIPATYLMARAALGSRWVALLAAFFVAVAYWPVTLSRFGMRLGFTPLAVAVTLFFLFQGLRHNRRSSFLLGGLALGLGMYSYSGFRVLPLAVALVVAIKLAIDLVAARRVNWTLLGNGLLMGLMALIVFAPLGRYALDSPDNYWHRVETLSTRGGGVEDPLPTLAGNVKNALLMFNWTGDKGTWVNVPYQPALDYVAGALLVGGLAVLAVRWWRKREGPPLYLPFFLAVMLLPTVLALRFPDQNPSFARASGAVPLAMTLPALGLYALGSGLRRALPRVTGLVAAVLAVGVVAAAVAAINFRAYFDDYDKSYSAHVPNASEVAGVISDWARENGGIENAYLKVSPYWLDTRAVAIDLGDLGWNKTNVLFEMEQASPQLSKSGPLLYVLHLQDADALAWLRVHYPTGVAQTVMTPSGRPFMSFVSKAAGGGQRALLVGGGTLSYDALGP
jgi:4-amino-4-deoxy-L-arabinose transferase-like glycosyltransferase